MLDRKERITSAQLTGLAAAYAQMRRLTADQALDEMATDLAPYPADKRSEILADAAASYVGGDRHYDGPAAELLAQAGADLEQARAIRAVRALRPDMLRAVADQANRAPGH